MIKELLGSPATKVYANWMGWFQANGGKHIAGVCQSDDPRTIRKQIRMAKAIGVDGFVADWYGYNPDQSAPSNQATLELMTLCEEEGFEFSIMLDSGIFKWRADMSAAGVVSRNAMLKEAMTYVQNNFMVSPAYSKINGLPAVWEFGLRDNGIDMAAFTAAFPNQMMMYQNSIGAGPSVGSFAWVAGFPNAGIPYLANYLSTHAADPGPVVPCLFWQFDDHDPKTPANSIWGGPARLIAPAFGDTVTGCIGLVKMFLQNAKNAPAVQLCTWNDYEERTAFEPIAKALTGTTLL
jgi:hypothetical protein